MIMSDTPNGSLTEIASWVEAQNDLEPLSLVLFKGKDLVSRAIQKVTSFVTDDEAERRFGVWSHIGVLVNDKVMDVENIKPGQWAVYEMTCRYE